MIIVHNIAISHICKTKLQMKSDEFINEMKRNEVREEEENNERATHTHTFLIHIVESFEN